MSTKNVVILSFIVLTSLAGLGAGAVLNPYTPSSSTVGLPQGVSIEYGTVTIDAKWSGDQTRGSSAVTFKTRFSETPIVMANQYGRGGWHFFVHAIPSRNGCEFSVMLDRSFHGREPRQHPCQIAYVAIGKKK